MLRYSVCAPISLAMNLFVILTCWFWAGWAAIVNQTTLPGPFSLLHTHDTDIYGSGFTNEPAPKTITGRWLRAMWWMCRNPAYGFDAFVLGFPAKADAPKWAEEIGFGFFRFVSADGRRLWSYRRNIPLTGSRYCKVWFGWKPNAPTGQHMIVFDINPFKKKRI